jgi:hypothetical protein
VTGRPVSATHGFFYVNLLAFPISGWQPGIQHRVSGNTGAGEVTWPERTPIPGWDHLSNKVIMKTKNAAVTRCHFALQYWAHARLVGKSRHGLVERIVINSVINRTLTYDWQSEGFTLDVPAGEEKEPPQDYLFMFLPVSLASDFEKLAKAHGFSRKAALSFVLKWGAMHMPRKDSLK